MRTSLVAALSPEGLWSQNWPVSLTADFLQCAALCSRCRTHLRAASGCRCSRPQDRTDLQLRLELSHFKNAPAACGDRGAVSTRATPMVTRHDLERRDFLRKPVR